MENVLATLKFRGCWTSSPFSNTNLMPVSTSAACQIILATFVIIHHFFAVINCHILLFSLFFQRIRNGCPQLLVYYGKLFPTVVVKQRYYWFGYLKWKRKFRISTATLTASTRIFRWALPWFSRWPCIFERKIMLPEYLVVPYVQTLESKMPYNPNISVFVVEGEKRKYFHYRSFLVTFLR